MVMVLICSTEDDGFDTRSGEIKGQRYYMSIFMFLYLADIA